MNKSVTRRGFFKLAAAATAGTVIAYVVRPRSVFAAEESLKSTIGNNHGHVFAIDLQTLLANGPKTYDIQGDASHPHDLVITQEILDALQSRKAVDVDSSTTARHLHVVRLEIV